MIYLSASYLLSHAGYVGKDERGCLKKHLEITVDGHKLSVEYRNCESDDLIVFIHGLGCSSKSFHKAWDFDRLANYSLLAFDLSGFGLSDKPVNYSYAMEDQAELCRKVLEQFRTKRVHIVAHSMGGTIGLLLAQKFLSHSFINVEGNLIAEDSGLISRNTIKVSEQDFVNHGFFNLCQLLADYRENCFDLANAMPEAFYRSAESLVEWSDSGKLLNLFEELTIPRLYVYGQDNVSMPILQKLNIQTTTEQIPNSGHFPMIDNSDAFYSVVADFVKC